MKSYTLTINKNYAADWGIEEAVRELLQNAIDHKKYEVNYNDGYLTIRNFNVTLEKKSLILGYSNKQKNSIGKFGEGFKLALLVLTRLNRSVTIFNGPYIWQSKIRYNQEYDSNLLVIDEKDNSNKLQRDLVFQLTITEKEWAKIKTNCLQLQEPTDDQHIFKTSKGDIILDKKKKIYVNGLFVTDEILDFSYNIKPEYLPLDRDRKTLSYFDLRWLLKDLWLEVLRNDNSQMTFVFDLLKQGCPDLEFLSQEMPLDLRNKLSNLFDYSDKLPISVFDDSSEFFVNTVVVPEGLLSILKGSDKYKYLKKADPNMPVNILKDFRKVAKKQLSTKLARKFNDIIKQSFNWRVK